MADDQQQSARRGSGRNPLLAVFTTVFIDLLGFGILIPVFPLLINPASPYRITPASWSPTQGLIMLGWLQAVFPLFIFLAAPILGQLSDRHGRRPVLALSIAGTSISYVVFAIGIVTKNIPLLFVARAFDGITGGNLAVANAAIGDISNETNRAKNFGTLGAAFGLGFIIGPYLGGRLSAPDTSFYGLFDTPGWFGPTTPFWFAAALSALNCALILWALPETLAKRVEGGRLRITQSVSNVVQGFTSPRLRVPLLSSFLFGSGFTFFTTFFGVYLARKFSFTPSKTGDYFALVGLAIAISQGLLVGLLSKRLTDYKILRFSYFGNAVGMTVYFMATQSWVLYAGIPLFTIFNALSMANMTSLISRSAEPGRQGEAMGISSSVQSLAQVPAAALTGYVANDLSSNTPLVVAMLLILAAGVAFLALFRPRYVNDTAAGGRPGAPAH